MTIPEFTIVSGETRPGLAPTRTVLPNGVVIIAKETPTLPAVTISLAMRAGSVCDPVDAPGAVFLLSRVLDRGTTMRSAADIAEDLDSRGITLTLGVTRHILSLACTCLTEDFEAVCTLLGEIQYFSTMRPYLFTTYTGFWKGVFYQEIGWEEMQRSAGFCGLYSAVFLLAAYVVFRWKDVKT